jgi:hypothetical protein
MLREANLKGSAKRITYGGFGIIIFYPPDENILKEAIASVNFEPLLKIKAILKKSFKPILGLFLMY